MLLTPKSLILVRLKTPEIAVRFGDDPASLTRVIIESTRLAVRFVQAITINDNSGGVASVECSLTTAANVNVNRVLALLPDGRVEHADKDNPAHCGQVIGFSKQSVVLGGIVKIIKFGILPSATLGAIGTDFVLGNNGQLVTTQPASGFMLHVGLQLSGTDFFVRIEDTIQL